MSDSPSESGRGSAVVSSLELDCRSLCQFIRSRVSESELCRECSFRLLDTLDSNTKRKYGSKISTRFMSDNDAALLVEVIECLELCSDEYAILALTKLIQTYLNGLKKGKLRRIRIVNQLNGNHLLLRCLHSALRNDRNRFFSCGAIHTLVDVALTLATRDRKFSLRMRLSGLQQTVTELIFKQLVVSDHSLPLLDLLIFATKSGRNAQVLGRQKEFLDWLLVGITPPIRIPAPQLRRNCEILFFISRNRKNRQRLIHCGTVSILLRLFRDIFERRSDREFAEVCLITLGCLRQLTRTKTGREQLISEEGLSVFEGAITGSLTHGSQDNAQEPLDFLVLAIHVYKCQISKLVHFPVTELESSLCALCLRCLPCQPFPLEKLPFPIVFELPQEAKKAAKAIDSSAESDDDEKDFLEEADDVASDDEPGENEAGPAPAKHKRKVAELENSYKKYFSELFINTAVPRDSDSAPSRNNRSSARSSPSFRDDSSIGSRSPSNSRKNHRRRTNSSDGFGSDGQTVRKVQGSPNKTRKLTKVINGTKGKGVKTVKTGSKKGKTNGGTKRAANGYGDLANYPSTDALNMQARKTRAVINFVKLAYPDLVSGYPDLPLQPLKYFPLAMKQTVLAELQKFRSDMNYPCKTVYDLDLLVRSSSRSPSEKEMKSDDAKKIGRPSTSTNGDSLKFESRFECGNLRKVNQIGAYEYEMYLSPDVNQVHQHYQWFYFQVSNMQAAVPYSFKIVNCLKSHSMFNAGMQPVLFSVAESLAGRPGWVRAGHAVCYYRNFYYQQTSSKSKEGRGYYTIGFTVTFRHAHDICYVAYHFPYTYSFLQCQLSEWSLLCPNDIHFRNEILCNSLGGNATALLTITAHDTPDVISSRDLIFLSSRVHPGESNASWIMHGTIRFLMSNHPKAVECRKLFLFKIVPMLNPDGVINGSHRCSLSGHDLNRQWAEPSLLLHPVIYHTKGLLQYLDSIKKTPMVFCDYHGHSRKSNVFVFGNNPEESWWVLDHAMQHTGECFELPQVLDSIAPAFNLEDCRFAIQKAKEPSARVTVFRQLGIRRAYTMESTYCGFDQGLYQANHVGTRELMEMGEKFCEALLVLKQRMNAAIRRDSSSSSSDREFSI